MDLVIPCVREALMAVSPTEHSLPMVDPQTLFTEFYCDDFTLLPFFYIFFLLGVLAGSHLRKSTSF